MKTPVNLYEMCVRWDHSSTNTLSRPYFVDLLRQLETHATLRFGEYGPFADDAKPFLERLSNWLFQIGNEASSKAMLEFVRWIMFLDRREMTSLYRDVFRRIIVPWAAPPESDIDYYLAQDYDHKLLQRLKTFDFYSITESFQHKTFENVNSLAGLRKPVILGENVKLIPKIIERSISAAGVIILEDVVGTGSQAARVLKKITKTLGPDKPILFAPLLMLQVALSDTGPLSKIKGVVIRPTTVIPSWLCLNETTQSGEPEVFEKLRTIVRTTAKRVLERLNDTDDPPDNAFGFGGVGALLVTHQNTPNNTVSLIHHKAPKWEPLFRRSHHSYGVNK